MPTEAKFDSRPSAGAHDLVSMYDLAAATLGNVLHVAELPWRLSSPSARMPERTRLWENAGGALVAWATLQFPAWYCLDFVVRPNARSADLEATVLAWAVERLETEATDRGGHLPFYVSARANDGARIKAIEKAGFARQNWSYVHFVRDLDRPIPAPKLPEGFTIRPLAGEREAEAYAAMHRAAFDTTNMTADWRQTTLRDPRYVPDLDLVAVGPEGNLAAFCVGWITPPLASLAGQRLAQVEPLGVLPEHQRKGLGRALLLEVLRRAKALGAHRIEVDAESYNEASRGTYEALGFQPAFEAPFFLRSFNDRPSI